MTPAQEKLEKDLQQTEFAALRVPLVTNVDADTIENRRRSARGADPHRSPAPVRWEESVRLLIDEGVNTFVEVGPGRVLSGLLRQIERSVATLNVEDEKSLAATVEKIAGARSDAGLVGQAFGLSRVKNWAAHPSAVRATKRADVQV